jgi:hypothetical protein
MMPEMNFSMIKVQEILLKSTSKMEIVLLISLKSLMIFCVKSQITTLIQPKLTGLKLKVLTAMDPEEVISLTVPLTLKLQLQLPVEK